METIEQEKFLRNMPKALDDRIVHQVGYHHRLFDVQHIIAKSGPTMIAITFFQVDHLVQVPNLARAIAAEHLLQVVCQLHLLSSYKPLTLSFSPTK